MHPSFINHGTEALSAYTFWLNFFPCITSCLLSNWKTGACKMDKIRRLVGNETKIFNMMIALFFLVPVFYMIYLCVIVAIYPTSFKELFSSSPFSAVMLIASCLDLLMGYYLYHLKVHLNNHDLFMLAIYLSALIQLLLGNLLIAFFIVLLILSSPNKKIKLSNLRNDASYLSMLGAFLVMYMFCDFVLLKLMI